MPFSKYSPAQKRLAAVAPPRKKITEADFKVLRKSKKNAKNNSKRSQETRKGFKGTRRASQNVEITY